MKTSEVLQEVRPAIIVCSGPDPLSLFIGRPQGGAVLLCNVGAVVHLSDHQVGQGQSAASNAKRIRTGRQHPAAITLVG